MLYDERTDVVLFHDTAGFCNVLLRQYLDHRFATKIF
jgi:hypothetical protein